MFRTIITSRPARLLAAAGVLGLLATGCTSNSPETDDARLERPGRCRQRQRRPRREGHHRLLRPRGRPRLARRRQQLRQGGGREVLGHRLQGRRGHERREPADQPDRDLHQRQGRRHRPAADRRRRPHRGRHQGDAGRHHRRQRRPRVLLARSPPAPPSSATTTAWASAPAPTPASSSRTRSLTNPVIAEIAGIDSLPLTQDRSKGYADALKACNQTVDNRVAAEFTVESGEKAASNLLQAAPKIDVLWNHDDDQGVGVMAALDNANRHEMAFIGGAGSANAMRWIQEGKMEATVLYPPTQAADGIRLARLLAPEQGHVRPRPAERAAPRRPRRARRDQGQRRGVPAAGLRVLTLSDRRGARRPAGRPASTTHPPPGRQARGRCHMAIDTPVTHADRRADPRGTPGRLGIGMVGYAFMGVAHSQGWRNARSFFDPAAGARPRRDRRPGRRGRRRHGAPLRLAARRDRLAGASSPVPTSTSSTSARPATPTPRSPSRRSRRASTCCARSPSPTPSPRRAPWPRPPSAPRPAASARWSASPTAACPPSRWPASSCEEGRIGEIRHVRAQYLQDWLVDPESPLTWRLQKDRAGSRRARRHRGAHHRPHALRHRRADHRRQRRHRDLRARAAPARRGPRAVRRGRAPAAGQVTVDDAAIFLGRLSGGALATFEATRFATGRKNAIRLEINGSRGQHRLRLRGHERPARPRRVDLRHASPGSPGSSSPRPTHPYVEHWWPAGHGLGYEHGFTHQAADLIDAIAAGSRPRAVVRRRPRGAARSSPPSRPARPNGSSWTPQTTRSATRTARPAAEAAVRPAPTLTPWLTTTRTRKERAGRRSIPHVIAVTKEHHERQRRQRLRAGHASSGSTAASSSRRRRGWRPPPRSPPPPPWPAPGANGVLIPPGKRGIILYTVRDAVSRDPTRPRPFASGFKEVLEELARIGYKQIEFAGFTPARQRPGGATSTTSRAPTLLRTLARRPTGSRPRATTAPSRARSPTRRIAAVRHGLRDRQHPRAWATSAPAATPRAAPTSPTGTLAAERWNFFGERAASHGLKLYTHNHDIAYSFLLDSGPLDALGRPTRVLRRPPSRVLPGEHRPGVRLPRDGHLLGARRAVQAPHLHRSRRHLGAGRSSTRRPSVAAQTTRFPLFHAKDGRRDDTVANGYVMAPFGEGDIDYSTFFAGSAPRGTTTRCGSRTPLRAAPRTQGSRWSSRSSATTTWRPCAAEPRSHRGTPVSASPGWWRPHAVAAADATPGLARPTLTKDVNMKSILRRGRPRAFSTLAALSLILTATGGALAAPAAAHSGVDHGSEPGPWRPSTGPTTRRSRSPRTPVSRSTWRCCPTAGCCTRPATATCASPTRTPAPRRSSRRCPCTATPRTGCRPSRSTRSSRPTSGSTSTTRRAP